MTNVEQIAHSLLPRAEGLLLGIIGGLEIENFNREGAARTMTDVIALLHKVRLLLEPQLNSEQEPLLPQAHVKCQLPHPVQFGRWLLKYCEPVWDEGFLTWSHEGKLIDTKELYDVFEAQCANALVSGNCGSTSARPLLNWIRVTEKLPNDDETVLIWRRSNKPALATFKKETQHGNNLFVVKDVGAHLDFSWVSHWASIDKPKP